MPSSGVRSAEELLCREECEIILQNVLNKEAAKLLTVSVITDSNSVGYLGEYFHLLLNYESENKPHAVRLFVKTLPYHNEEMTLMISKVGILKKEITIYKTLLEELRKYSSTRFCASCYFARDDLFVMQNVSDLGYEIAQQPSGFLSLSQVRATLKGLATLHACSIAYEVKKNVNIGKELEHVLFEPTIAPTVDWYTAGLRAVQAVALTHPTYQSEFHQEVIRHKLQPSIDAVYEMVNPSAKYRNVFCHRDAWGGNILFNRENQQESAILVDFQLCRYCPAAIDVLMAIYLNLPHKERKPAMHELCSYYYQCFSQELQSIHIDANEHMSEQVFQKSIEEFKLFGALYTCICATILRLPDGYLTKLKAQNPKAFHQYTNVDRTDEVLKIIKQYPEFQQYMYECIEEFLEIVLKTA